MRRRRTREADAGPRLESWILELETEPFRRYWLTLTPGQRLLRSWRMRRQLTNPEAAHDALSLPRI